MKVNRSLRSHRRRGDDLLRHHPQSVHHGDVAQPPSYTQSCVAILEERETRKVCHLVCVHRRRRACLCALTHHSDGVGLGAILQEHIDDVCVSLLGCLVKRSVSILKVEEKSNI